TKMSEDLFIGQTIDGGQFGYGTVFTVNASTGVVTKKIDRNGTYGGRTGPFLSIGGGKYLSAALNAGTGSGSMFKYDSTANSLSTACVFPASSQGPIGPIILASNGLVYGTARWGGPSSNGVIYSFNPITNLLTNVHVFNVTDGKWPDGGVVQGSNGKLYGFTISGGASGVGVMFEFDPVTSGFSKLVDLTSLTGHNHYGSLTEVTPGEYYGVAYTGGAGGGGVIFKYSLLTSTYSVVYNFGTLTDGSGPKGTLTLKNGKLYGVTMSGGNHYVGTIFEFDPASSTVNTLHHFYLPQGAMDYYDSYCIECVQPQLLIGCPPITISSVTIPAAVCEGSSITLEVAATGTSTSYSWYKNGVAIPSSDTAVFVISSATISDQGTYHCEITNGCRTVVSSSTLLSVFPNTLSVTATASTTSICEGAAVIITPASSQPGTIFSISPAPYTGTSLLPLNSGYVMVIGTSPAGCIGKDSVMITVNPCVEVWPGDADVSGTVDMDDLLSIGLEYGSFGGSRTLQDNVWSAHSASPWTDTLFSGFNSAHSDCNGDGIVDSSDTLAVSSNFGFVRNGSTPSPLVTEADITVELQSSFYFPGDFVTANIYAGTATAPLNDIYGLAFNIAYDSNIIQPGTYSIAFNNSWLGSVSSELLGMSKVSGATGVTRKDHTSRNGFGQIGTLSFQLKTVLAVDSILITVTDAHGTDEDGNFVNLTGAGSVATSTSVTENNDIVWNLYPNPVHDGLLTIVSNVIPLRLSLLDISGRLVFQKDEGLTKRTEMQIPGIAPGVYFLQADSEKGTFMKKIIIE
nr:T9SS type A sorting domain-containing protein [Bacteroidota bacterium]